MVTSRYFDAFEADMRRLTLKLSRDDYVKKYIQLSIQETPRLYHWVASDIPLQALIERKVTSAAQKMSAKPC